MIFQSQKQQKTVRYTFQFISQNEKENENRGNRGKNKSDNDITYFGKESLHPRERMQLKRKQKT